MSRISTPNNPTMDTMVSISDHVSMVSRILKPKYSLNIQKPVSFTWENINEPAPVASTINSALVSVVPINGSVIPAAIRPATVAEPKATRMTAAMTHTKTNGDNESAPAQAAISSPTPLSTSTCLNEPAAPMISKIMTILRTDSSKLFITSFIVRPRAIPMVKTATNTAMRRAITGLPMNDTTPMMVDPVGKTNDNTDASAMSSTGNRPVNKLIKKPGVSDAGGIANSMNWAGGLGCMPFNMRENITPPSTTAGIATAIP